MFERYTEKARRVIFFARYEASRFGSSSIDTEHILLGLLREDYALMRRFLGPIHLGQIRPEIEKVINRGKPIPTFVEVPLSDESKTLLNLAAEQADKLGQRGVGTEHILLAILGVKDSLAAKLLTARGARAGAIRDQIAKHSAPVAPSAQLAKGVLLAIDGFLATLKGGSSEQLAAFFDERGQFVDSSGKRWIGRKEIDKAAETLSASFAKKNCRFLLEDTISGPSDTVVASVLWEFAAVSGDQSKSTLRMSIVLAPAGEEWAIVLAQVTPFLPRLGPTG
jgi:ATP-dependent Clp protease ATP-binding subunit ClpA